MKITLTDAFQRSFALFCVLTAALLTGCVEAPIIGGKVVISFPTADQTSMSLAVSDAEVQEALTLVDDLLVSNRFEREENSEHVSDQGLVTSYYRLNNEGQRRLGGAVSVYLRANLLEVVFLEGREPSAEVRMSVNRMLNLLKNKLSRRYGSDRITVVALKS